MEGQYLSNNYWKITIEGKVHNVHRLLWEQANGPIPAGFVIDHIDRDTLNNELTNLRAVSVGANRANSKQSRELPKGVFTRFAKRLNQQVYYGDIRIGGFKHTYPPTVDRLAVELWAKETHARLMEAVYCIS